jgi:hypothetical protein
MLPSTAALLREILLRSILASALWDKIGCFFSLVGEIPLAEILSPLYGDSHSPKSDFDSALSLKDVRIPEH